MKISAAKLYLLFALMLSIGVAPSLVCACPGDSDAPPEKAHDCCPEGPSSQGPRECCVFEACPDKPSQLSSADISPTFTFLGFLPESEVFISSAPSIFKESKIQPRIVHPSILQAYLQYHSFLL